MMKAIVSTNYGSPDILQLQKVEKPVPKQNEILIKIYAAAITRADTMMRTGKPYFGRLIMGLTKPKNAIGGTGFAGVIETIGADVKLFKKGDQVFGENISSFGTHAEYVCLPEDGVVAVLPDNITYQEAAPVCDGALTSMNFLKNIGGIKKGQKVLINGASGSLGTAAIQIAKHLGAKVTGVCSTSNVALVESLGADKVIDYTKQDFTANYNEYDIIYDTVGKRSFSDCKRAMTEKGIYISPVLSMSLLGNMIWTSLFAKKKARFSATGILPITELNVLLKGVIKMIEAGKLHSVIDKSYLLEEVPEAHRYVDGGHKKGNVIINLE